MSDSSVEVLREEPQRFDVFLSHASEDKDDVARPLAEALRGHGLSVWYDEFELRVGDNLAAKLNAGISASRFGIIVLSEAFFAKRWTNHELNMLEHLWVTEGLMLFPIWHQLTEERVRAYRPSLASLVARSTDSSAIGEIAEEIHEVILDYYARQLPGSSEEF